MSTAETWTIGRLLTWTTDYLKKNNSASPRLEAELLLAEACGCERIQLYTRFEEVLADPIRNKFRGFVKQRAEGTPVAYLLGHKEFYSLNFRVTPDVLIPRPETEFAVIAVLDRLKERSAEAPPAKIADVGTGSGCIAITLAKQAPAVSLLAVDISSAALNIARENAQSHGVSDRIRFVESNLLDAIPAERNIDIIVSNPPYVSEAEYAALTPDVKNHEPRGALVGGNAGTEIIAQLIPQAAARLVPGGWLIMEFSPMIAAAVRQLLEADGHFEAPSIQKDLAGLARIIQAKRKA
jgi:release factor glutamine methyltransferase